MFFQVTDVITLDDETRTFYTASLDRTIWLVFTLIFLVEINPHDQFVERKRETSTVK